MYLEPKFGSSLPHEPEAFLEVGPAPPHEDDNVPLGDLMLVFGKSTHDALESGGNISEVGNASADDEHLALGVGLLGHQTQDSPGIFKCLTFTRGT